MRCVLGDYDHHSHLLFVTLGPIVIVALLGLVAFALQGKAPSGNTYHPDAQTRSTASTTPPHQRCLQAAVLVLIIVLPTTSTAIFRTFSCRSFDQNHGRFLIADLSIDCDSETHHAFEAFAIFAILLYPIGVPMIFFGLLVQKRDLINPRVDSEDLAYSARGADKSLAPLRLLFDAYRPGIWWFECVDLLRRNLMMGALTFIVDLKVRVVVGLGLAIVSAVSYREMSPFSADTVSVLSTAGMNQVRACCNSCCPIIYDSRWVSCIATDHNRLLFWRHHYPSAIQLCRVASGVRSLGSNDRAVCTSRRVADIKRQLAQRTRPNYPRTRGS